MKTIHLHFTTDSTPALRVRLHPANATAFGVEITIGEIDHTAFFATADARRDWLLKLCVQVNHALDQSEAPASAADILPPAQTAI